MRKEDSYVYLWVCLVFIISGYFIVWVIFKFRKYDDKIIIGYFLEKNCGDFWDLVFSFYYMCCDFFILFGYFRCIF